MTFLLFLLYFLVQFAIGQWEPNPTNPPHGCANYGLCSPFVTWNTTYLDCPASKCICLPGTSGVKCADLDDECTKNPCPAGNFNCTNVIGGKTCDCVPGYEGSNCMYSSGSICVDNPCFNGGTCQTTDNKNYTCKCPAGYLPPRCEYKNPCNPNPCNNGGACSPLYDGASFYCTCTFDWIGRYCATRVTQWDINSLQFDGCYSYDSILENSAKYKKFTDNKMSFKMCSDILRTYLADNIIFTTIVVMENNCYLSTANFLSSKDNLMWKNPKDDDCWRTCPGEKSETCGTDLKKVMLGFDKTTTQSPKKCETLPSSTCGNSTNIGICINMAATVLSAGYTCACRPPYVLNSANTVASNPCSTVTCRNGGTCVPKTDYSNYTCICADGFVGRNCELKSGCIPDPCENGGTCEETSTGDYSCHCLTWYSGKNCQEVKACDYAQQNTSLCVNGDCRHSYKNITLRVSCACKLGWTGTRCDRELNYCTQYEPCMYNSTCIPKFAGYDCNCIKGTDGTNCTNILNNCLPYWDENARLYPTRCNTRDTGAICINGIDSFTCNCTSQWRGKYCELNVIIEEVMGTVFGEINYAFLPLLNNLLSTPAAINNMVPFILGTNMSLTERSSLSWSYDDMFYWATFEEKQLNITRDFVKWNDVVLGNCFTFNHYNSTQFYEFRSTKVESGLKVRMKVNQEEYEPWTETAAMLVFIHNKDDYVFSESIRYNAEPNNQVTMYSYTSQFTRLGGSYGRCVKDIKEVKSYYYPGKYTSDGCFRSCYQDLILKNCACMDPRYPMPVDVPGCKVVDMACIDGTIEKYGDPSTWSFCVCPVPCENQNFAIDWSTSSSRISTPNCMNPVAPTASSYGKCQEKTADSVIVNVAVRELTFSLLEERPAMELNKFIGNLGGLLGVLMGIAAITFIEVIVMIIRVVTNACCFDKPK